MNENGGKAEGENQSRVRERQRMKSNNCCVHMHINKKKITMHDELCDAEILFGM